MSGKKDSEGPWRQTSVIIRSDIWLKAAEQGLDISDELNQRLAELVGIDYRRQRLADRLLPDPVDTPDPLMKGVSGRQRSLSQVLHPVINADDPAAAAKVRKAKREILPEPVMAVPVAVESPPRETGIPLVHSAAKVPKTEGPGSAQSKKKGKEEGLKKFVAAKISRTDADDAAISKEEMYQAFTRWCRDHRIAAVPERKVFATLLKNKFAIPEKTVNGTSYWVNVRLG